MKKKSETLPQSSDESRLIEIYRSALEQTRKSLTAEYGATKYARNFGYIDEALAWSIANRESPHNIPGVVSDEDIQKAIALKTPFDDTNTFGHEMWATGFELGVIWLDEWLYNAGIRPETQTKAVSLTTENEPGDE